MNRQVLRKPLVPTVFLVVALTFFAEHGVLGVLSQVTPQTQPSPQTPGSKEFSDRMQDYVKVRKEAETSIPPLNKTDKPEVIAAREQALAKKIRELRPNAKRGDIFTPSASEALQRAIKTVFAGPDANRAQATIQAGEPLKGFEVQVNQRYPDGLPFTTVPPTLLLALPRLPDDMSYRILGSDLLIVDTTSRLIVDYLPDVIPVS